MPSIEKNITVKSLTENLGKIRTFLYEIADEAGFKKKEIEEIVLAADEACTNIIKHAYEFDPTQDIEITAAFDDERLTIKIKDYGKKFHPQSVEPPDLEAKLKKRKPGGLGVHLIKTLMDEVLYDFSNPDFNILTLVKKL